MISETKKKVRILLYGYINVNVMDGSAVFLTGFAEMLSSNKNLEIDFVLANTIQRDILLKSLYEKQNVNIIVPYTDEKVLKLNPELRGKNRMSHREAANIISYYWNQKNYDWLIIRGMEVAEELSEFAPEILKNTMTYVTGITHENQAFSKNKVEKINQVFEKSAYLLCQTEEMKKFLLDKFSRTLTNTEIIHLNPMIPDTSNNFEDFFIEKNRYNKLCYTGKFDEGWNTIPIIAGFKELFDENPDLILNVAGDKFNLGQENPYFIEEAKYLLQHTKNLHWYGAIPREDVRMLVSASDIGITWRHKKMDTSLELSTKLLEYGSLGKAVIMNPTKMHIKLFGEDYPLYAETIEDFVNAVSKAVNDPDVYKFAAKRMFEVSQKFTYSQTMKRLLPYLSNGRYKLFFSETGFKTPYLLDEHLKSFEQYPIIVNNLELINNKQEDKFLLVSDYLESLKTKKDFILTCSQYGSIEHLRFFGNLAFAIVKKTEQSVESNLISNFNSHFFDQLIINNKNISKQSNSYNIQQYLIKKQDNKSSKSKIPEEYRRKIKELEGFKKKYNALSTSKLGKLTIMYWKWKKRLIK